jgi:hypothetical protein
MKNLIVVKHIVESSDLEKNGQLCLFEIRQLNRTNGKGHRVCAVVGARDNERLDGNSGDEDSAN